MKAGQIINRRQKEGEMVVIAHDESIDIDNVPENMCVAYGPDMFYQSRIIIAENDYAVAKDDNHKVLLKNENNTYTHAYCYEKGDKIV